VAGFAATLVALSLVVTEFQDTGKMEIASTPPAGSPDDVVVQPPTRRVVNVTVEARVALPPLPIVWGCTFSRCPEGHPFVYYMTSLRNRGDVFNRWINTVKLDVEVMCSTLRPHGRRRVVTHVCRVASRCVALCCVVLCPQSDVNKHPAECVCMCAADYGDEPFGAPTRVAMMDWPYDKALIQLPGAFSKVRSSAVHVVVWAVR
jgi:hypothetical protein